MDIYKIEWKRSAIKELEKLPRPVILRIVSAVDNLSSTPFPQGVRKLVGTEGTYRIRVGEYRVLYTLAEKRLTIEVIRVRHRKDAYR
jgi:mRNA interferase RelE/StbE